MGQSPRPGLCSQGSHAPGNNEAQTDSVQVDLILPQEAADKLRMKLAQESYSPTYHRVIMKLADILDGEFFTQYIKVGSIIMLSQGNTSQDNVFSLKDGASFEPGVVDFSFFLKFRKYTHDNIGQLAMFLDKEAYERAGLVGKPHGVKGKRGLKPRWSKFDKK